MPSLILICGCGHTGSSILARVLGSNSSIFFVPKESGAFLANRYYLESTLIADFRSAAKGENKSLILEKTPRHIWHVDYVRNNYLNTKFILTTRDGRDVIASLYERYGDFQAALTRYKDDSIMTLRQLSRPDTMLVKYEEFVKNPNKVLNNLCLFVGVKFEEDMLDYHMTPLTWNIDVNSVEEQINHHDFLRNKQVNSRIEMNKIKWSERLPLEFHSELNEFFSNDNAGFKIMKDFGY